MHNIKQLGFGGLHAFNTRFSILVGLHVDRMKNRTF